MRPRLRALVRQLRREFPPLLPVRVYVRPKLDKGTHAYCELKFDGEKPARFAIVLAAASHDNERLYLLHEWAHALAWSRDECAEDHGDDWGIAYGRLYRRVMEG